jgi:hypothetical protein
MAEGNNNSKFFHNYANHCKSVNTIWDIGLANGSKEITFKDISELGMSHFHNVFKDPKNNNIGDLMKVVKKIPKIFYQRMNETLEAKVTKEKMKVVLHSFKKEKSLGFDG